jgi:hypothetical protein
MKRPVFCKRGWTDWVSLWTVYCPLLKRIQLTCAARVSSLNTDDDGRGRGGGKHKVLSKARVSIKTWRTFHWSQIRKLLGVSFVTSPQSHLCTSLAIQNTTENNRIISYAQNTTAFQANVFLTGIRRLLVGFLQSKLSRSTGNSWVIISILRYICYLQLGCHPVAVVQYTFTHKQYTKQTIRGVLISP